MLLMYMYCTYLMYGTVRVLYNTESCKVKSIYMGSGHELYYLYYTMLLQYPPTSPHQVKNLRLGSIVLWAYRLQPHERFPLLNPPP